jgi:hypothetical protein
LTYVHCAGSATTFFALVVFLLNPGRTFNAHTTQRVQAQIPPAAIVRRTPRRQRRSLIRHNEAGAIRNMFTLLSAEATYQSTTGNGDYGTLEELRKEGLIDPVLSEGHRFGYLFRVRREKHAPVSPSIFEIVAVPRTYGGTGRRSFYMNESGEIHAADKRGAVANLRDRLLVIDP